MHYIQKPMSMLYKSKSDNLIYNRFDIIHPDGYQEFQISYRDIIYRIDYYVHDCVADLNVWGKSIPEPVMQQVKYKIFNKENSVRGIYLQRIHSDIEGCTYGRERILHLPSSVEELNSRMKSSTKSRLRNKVRHLEDEFGEITVKHFGDDNIHADDIKLFFKWKMATHSRKYNLSEDEYLNKYHVTDIIKVDAGNAPIGIILYCKVDNILYLENISYDQALSKYSPGTITYIKWLDFLITSHTDKYSPIVYLGGDGLEYKRKFNSIAVDCYTGYIVKDSVFNDINSWFYISNIHTYVIYGLGHEGEMFLKDYRTKLNPIMIGGIDKNKKAGKNIECYCADGELPKADIALITVKNKDCEIEKLLSDKYEKVYYWDDFLYSFITKKP